MYADVSCCNPKQCLKLEFSYDIRLRKVEQGKDGRCAYQMSSMMEQEVMANSSNSSDDFE